jgi:hypothetical protein
MGYHRSTGKEYGMPKLDTLNLLNELERRGLDNTVFQTKLHHLGGTLNGFRAFTANVGFFIKTGCNQLLHDRLAFMLNRCNMGDLERGKTMGDLADEAKTAVCCRDYSSCKKHVSDKGCAKPK